MDVLLLGALPMLLLARTGPGLAAQEPWCVPCGAAFAAAAVVVSRVSRQPMGSGRSETGGPCSPTHRRPEWFRFSEGEGGAERGWEQQESESKRTDSMSCHEEFEAVRRHKSRVLIYVKAMLMCKSLRVTSSMAIIFPPTSFRPWRPGQRSRT
ncbi:uncharacterized protein LOC119267560 isoform X5 [Triticum dicoccoides]|uniref:uncharacterized protein LOC119267560 isoform X5 n=1 Tax=Triticum dicoccoides TaxID=85692 RepID=UPI00188EFBF4|nr:uncharacterized protein LOC119267560 isoform X5 [Triticum dicoccoides]